MTSHAPLFPESGAALPLGDGGRYVAYEQKAGRYVRAETVAVTREGAGYDYVAENGAVTPLTLHPLGGGLFAVQAKAERGGFEYARIRVARDAVYVEVADCARQDPLKLAALGVARGQGALPGAKADCALDGVTQARKAFRDLDFGRPTAKFVRE